MQAATASALYLALPNITGCTSVPKYKPIAPADGKALELINCNIINVAEGIVNRGKTVTIRRGVIESISDKIPSPSEGSLIVELKNQYIIPGLIDAHCHSTLSSEASFNPFCVMTTMRQIKRNYVQQLIHGVTTIRDMGALPKMLHKHLEMIKKDELTGPRVVYCNAFTNIKGSHPDVDPSDVSIFSGLTMSFTGNPNLWFKDIPELEEKMKRNVANGARFIKLTMDNTSVMCGKGDIPTYADEHLKVISEFAQKNNLPTAGHIHTKFGFDRAMQFGINSMEHAIADAALTDAEVMEMAKKDIAIVPTLIIAQMYASEEAYEKLPLEFRNGFIDNELSIRCRYLNSPLDDYIEPSIHKNNVAMLKKYRKYGCDNLYKNGIFLTKPDIFFNILLQGPKNLLKMKDAGVIIGCGTDSGVPLLYHGSLWREMEMLHRIGFSNTEVLRCATINNAKIIRMADKIGSIDTGKCADIVVLKENPLERLEACREPQMVIKDGRIYDVMKKV
ncbi:MAG: amidohydrolase family protein [Syntrophaceae bacterium]